MFSLIVVIISIALVAALALATLYYGGNAYSSAGDSAQAARLNNEAQQIEGAVKLFKGLEGRNPTGLEELAENRSYLSTVPQEHWVSTTSFVLTPEASPVSDAACLKFNETRGVPLIPQCDDPAYAQTTVCCNTP